MNRKSKVFAASVAGLLMLGQSAAFAAAPPPGTGATSGRIMNRGSASASMVVQYYDPAGTLQGTKTIGALAGYGSTPIDLSVDGTPLPTNWQGAVIASSDQDLEANAYTNYSGGGPFCDSATGQCGDGLVSADYPATYSPDTNLFFPSVARRDSEMGTLYLQNTNTSTPTNVRIRFFDRFGVEQVASEINRTVNGGGSTAVVISDVLTLPANFLGAAVVTSTLPVAGVAVHTWQYGMYAYRARPSSSASTDIVFPKVVRRCKAADGCTNAETISETKYTDSTGIVCVNSSQSVTATATIQFVNRAGTVESTYVDTVAPLSARGYNTRYQGQLSLAAMQGIRGLDAAGTSTKPNFLGSASVSSTQPLICIAKQIYDRDTGAFPDAWGGTDDISRETLAYNGLPTSAAATELYAPVVFKTAGTAPCATGQYRYSGIVLYNTTNTTATVTVDFRNAAGATVVSQADTLAPKTPRGYNTRFGAGLTAGTLTSLGSSFDGAARITSSQPVLGIIENWQNCPGVMTDSNASELNR